MSLGGATPSKRLSRRSKTSPALCCRKRMRPRRPGDPPVLVADASRARQVLKWSPSRSLRDIVSSAWQWAQKSDKRHHFIKP
jgi:UDP-glucose 4-epimerase